MNKTQKGFTLIELVVSIGVLAILAMFLLAALNPFDQFRKARDGQRKSDLAQIQRALEQYYQDHGVYPTSSSNYKLTDFNGVELNWGGSTGWSPYMNSVPKDPVTPARTYLYYSQNNGQSYRLYTSLEKGPTDPSTCKASVANCQQNPTSVPYCSCDGIPSNATCGSNLPCNFGVSSPNTTP